MTPEQQADLAFYVELGRLVVELPEETEAWYWRKRILESLEAERQGEAA